VNIPSQKKKKKKKFLLETDNKKHFVRFSTIRMGWSIFFFFFAKPETFIQQGKERESNLQASRTGLGREVLEQQNIGDEVEGTNLAME
jgi:hypothetical protein